MQSVDSQPSSSVRVTHPQASAADPSDLLQQAETQDLPVDGNVATGGANTADELQHGHADAAMRPSAPDGTPPSLGGPPAGDQQGLSAAAAAGKQGGHYLPSAGEMFEFVKANFRELRSWAKIVLVYDSEDGRHRVVYDTRDPWRVRWDEVAAVEVRLNQQLVSRRFNERVIITCTVAEIWRASKPDLVPSKGGRGKEYPSDTDTREVTDDPAQADVYPQCKLGVFYDWQHQYSIEYRPVEEKVHNHGVICCEFPVEGGVCGELMMEGSHTEHMKRRHSDQLSEERQREILDRQRRKEEVGRAAWECNVSFLQGRAAKSARSGEDGQNQASNRVKRKRSKARRYGVAPPPSMTAHQPAVPHPQVRAVMGPTQQDSWIAELERQLRDYTPPMAVNREAIRATALQIASQVPGLNDFDASDEWIDEFMVAYQQSPPVVGAAAAAHSEYGQDYPTPSAQTPRLSTPQAGAAMMTPQMSTVQPQRTAHYPHASPQQQQSHHYYYHQQERQRAADMPGWTHSGPACPPSHDSQVRQRRASQALPRKTPRAQERPPSSFADLVGYANSLREGHPGVSVDTAADREELWFVVRPGLFGINYNGVDMRLVNDLAVRVDVDLSRGDSGVEAAFEDAIIRYQMLSTLRAPASQDGGQPMMPAQSPHLPPGPGAAAAAVAGMKAHRDGGMSLAPPLHHPSAAESTGEPSGGEFDSPLLPPHHRQHRARRYQQPLSGNAQGHSASQPSHVSAPSPLPPRPPLSSWPADDTQHLPAMGEGGYAADWFPLGGLGLHPPRNPPNLYEDDHEPHLDADKVFKKNWRLDEDSD
ncbi:unnamed protein product [Vitrella brassicaformis CCMP3155]|uniref:Uncharacterized protein n=1 Tax=Vitrella brassicaformis (strain CCMP3155) TaxID=1169540 RepID=A0A0G4GMD0_VITBC|nr:unnamed protein product [Vitrella brassicaformis CCMP3155]|eukprot:CEM31356.1 unnamed protein product [Vitrella brassicaformis CCMP3155]